MNFQELLSRLNTLDQQPVQESDKAKKDYDGDGEVESGKDEYYGSRMKAAFPKDKEKEKEVDESFIEGCGMDMPGSMMGMRTPPQQDSVSMNLSMNGAGANGIRDLMDILRNLDGDEGGQMDLEMPGMDHGHDGMDSEMPIIMKALGGDQGDSGHDEEERMPLGDEMYYGIDAVTQGGADLNRPKQTFPKVAGGDNPMQPMAERIAEQLRGLYSDIKLREASGDKKKCPPMSHIKKMCQDGKSVTEICKMHPDCDQKELKQMVADCKKTLDEASMPMKKVNGKSVPAFAADGKGKNDLSKTKEAYNPNSVDAEHRRGLEKSHEDSLKKKAAAGDESAKKRLQALKDKKERMANDYNDRMER